MKRKTDIAFLIVVLAMLLIPVALTDTEEGAISDADGRTLLAKPLFDIDSFQSDMESWLRDRLGLRDDIAVAYAVANDKLFGELINPYYQYGKDGWTFFKLNDNIQFSSYHIQFADMVADMKRYCESRGTKFYYLFNPEKESIYRAYLPAGVNYNDEWVDEMLSYMESRGINCIDLRDTLTAVSGQVRGEADKPRLVFNKTFDAGHWNYNGAYYGMRELTKAMRREIPNVQVLEKNEYDITTTIVEKNYGSNQLINEEIPSYALKAGYEDITGDLALEVKRDPNNPYFQLVFNKSDKAKAIDRLLLFEDVLYGPVAFSRARETAVVSCMQNTINFDYYYNIFKPDVVVLENMEYVVDDVSFNKVAMQEAKQNPSILSNFPEEDFEERRDAMLENATKYAFESDPKAVIIPGKSIDRVFLSSGMISADYAYLITDNRVIDLKRNELGAFETSIMHGELSSEFSKPIMYIISDTGEKEYAVIDVVSQMSNIAILDNHETENVTIDKSTGKYTMTTSTKGNAFSNAVLQLHDSETFIENLGSLDSAGQVDGAYCHKFPTGEYTLRLRAGSNLIDEWASFSVHLEKGQSYWFTFNMDELADSQVVFSGFMFGRPESLGK